MGTAAGTAWRGRRGAGGSAAPEDPAGQTGGGVTGVTVGWPEPAGARAAAGTPRPGGHTPTHRDPRPRTPPPAQLPGTGPAALVGPTSRPAPRCRDLRPARRSPPHSTRPSPGHTPTSSGTRPAPAPPAGFLAPHPARPSSAVHGAGGRSVPPPPPPLSAAGTRTRPGNAAPPPSSCSPAPRAALPGRGRRAQHANHHCASANERELR